ncbi:MAG: sigma 54-interacting transcriptional regulator [Gammaproteobacteria bacterium]|nr:sigma 54-interacting transcriptional regulator [Gammaproteobacteria bacterium]
MVERLLGTLVEGRLWREMIGQIFLPASDQSGALQLYNGRLVALTTEAYPHFPGQIVLLQDVTPDRQQQRKQGERRFISGDPKTIRMLAMARRVANSEVTVMITGESGSGKEVIARYLHRHSPRAEAPFIAVNCAAIPENMLEAQLFGYEKGAFTGAIKSAAGKFELVNPGFNYLSCQIWILFYHFGHHSDVLLVGSLTRHFD